MTDLLCPICRAKIAQRDADGRVIVRRDGQVVAIDPRVVCCRARRCPGLIEFVDRATLVARVELLGATGR